MVSEGGREGNLNSDEGNLRPPVPDVKEKMEEGAGLEPGSRSSFRLAGGLRHLPESPSEDGGEHRNRTGQRSCDLLSRQAGHLARYSPWRRVGHSKPGLDGPHRCSKPVAPLCAEPSEDGGRPGSRTPHPKVSPGFQPGVPPQGRDLPTEERWQAPRESNPAQRGLEPHSPALGHGDLQDGGSDRTRTCLTSRVTGTSGQRVYLLRHTPENGDLGGIRTHKGDMPHGI